MNNKNMGWYEELKWWTTTNISYSLGLHVNSPTNEDFAREFVKELNCVDSWTALQKVEEFILGNKYSDLSEEDKLKANGFLLYCLEKYGTLYPKSMNKYKWVFLWYEFFWGKIEDENYTTLQRESEVQNKPMNEEMLMFKFDFISDLVLKQIIDNNNS